MTMPHTHGNTAPRPPTAHQREGRSLARIDRLRKQQLLGNDTGVLLDHIAEDLRALRAEARRAEVARAILRAEEEWGSDTLMEINAALDG